MWFLSGVDHVPTPNVCSDVWDCVGSYAIRMLLAWRLKITFISNLKLILSILVLLILVLLFFKSLSIAALRQHAHVTLHTVSRLANRPSAKGSQKNFPSGWGVSGRGCFSSISLTLEAQEEWMAVMTRHDPAIVLPSTRNQTSLEKSIQPLDLSFVEKVLALRPPWSGWIMAIIIERERINCSWEIILAWICQKLVVVSLVWNQGEWIK